MKTNDVTRFRRLLEESVQELDHSTRRRDGILVDGSADELDRMQGANERELAGRNLQIVSAKQRQVRAALQRIEDGTYGICLECDEPISLTRLAALPWAPLCIRCQEAMDSRGGAGREWPALPKAA
jgi:DnaK suppressor protein